MRLAEQGYEQVLDRIETRGFADRLGERERTVIRAHDGLGQPAQTLNQIGGALKLREALAQPAPAGAS